jgi:outer membrane protein assembly factor BamD (BamD/ComL family)
MRPRLDRRIALAVSIVLLAGTLGQCAGGDDEAQVDRYLQRMGLTDLRLVHFQQQLNAADDEAARSSLARRLSELYAQRLLEAADEPARFSELVARVEQLLRDHPAADSPQLQVLLLQAEYQRAETLALACFDDPKNTEAHDQAERLLAAVGPRLHEQRQKLAADLERLQTQADAVEDIATESTGKKKKREKGISSVASLEQEMNRLQALVARALFFEGWSYFFYGLLRSPDNRGSTLAVAETAFAQLLDLNTEEKLELEPETMGLESVWRARSVLGLVATFEAEGKRDEAKACFDALKFAGTAPAIRDTALYWRLLALTTTGQLEPAHLVAAQELRGLSPGAAAGKVPALALLVRTGWGNAKASGPAQSLARLGLEGLAKLRQYDAMSALVAKYRPEPKPADGFYALWARGRTAFGAAEKSKEASDYNNAARWFELALEQREAADDPVAAAQARYSLAWCRYRTAEYEPALRDFRASAAQLKTLGDASAVQAAWMAFTCNQQLHAATKDERYQKDALESLTSLKRDFPNTEQAQKAELLLARLSAGSESPEKAIKALLAVPSDSPNYLSARYELTIARHRQWSEAKGEARAAIARDLLRDVDAYLASSPRSEGAKRVKATLLAVDVLLTEASPDWKAAGAYLDKVKSSADALSAEDPLSPELHYRRLQMAQHAGDEATARREAKFLTEHAADSSYELPALVLVAREADERLASTVSGQRQQRLREAIDIYQRLVRRVGEQSEIIRSKKNALVANSKLAQYEYEAGDFASAAKRLEAIVQAYPTDRTYLKRAGLAWVKAGKYEPALPHWTRLVAGTDSASDDWYEAKYYQLLCLVKTSDDEAGKAWRQFTLLHPEVKSAAWRDRFAELARTSFAGQ